MGLTVSISSNIEKELMLEFWEVTGSHDMGNVIKRFIEWLEETYHAKVIWQAYGDYISDLYFEDEKDFVWFNLKWGEYEHSN